MPYSGQQMRHLQPHRKMGWSSADVVNIRTSASSVQKAMGPSSKQKLAPRLRRWSWAWAL